MIKAVAPYFRPGDINFKTAAYETWKALGGRTATAHYPWRPLHGVVFRHTLPTIFGGRVGAARLRFVEPVSLEFDTFPDYALHETVPMVWDCWPLHVARMCRFIERYHVRTAIFTARQSAEEFRSRYPTMRIMHCPEAIDTTLYDGRKPLDERKIDILEFGRSNARVFNSELPPTVCHVATRRTNGRFIYSHRQLREAMADASLTVCFPRCDTEPQIAGDIETLTQRYWESMAAGALIIGRAPQELIDLVGYNPVITLDKADPAAHIQDIIAHIADYQPLASRNLATAISLGSWTARMRSVRQFLAESGYDV